MSPLSFIPEEIPKVTRVGGSGREPEKWEDHLAPVKESPGVSYRVWTYTKRTSAVSRMSSVRERLNKAVPHENWRMAVRSVPNSNPNDPETFGVYVQYDGTYTPEQVAENQRLHAERSARVKATRHAGNGANATVAPEPAGSPQEPSEPEPGTPDPADSAEPSSEPLSPRDRVRAARERQAATA